MADKVIGEEKGYVICVGKKNSSCYPCCWEGSCYPCPSDLCKKWKEEYLKENKFEKYEGIYLSKKNDTEGA